MVESFLEKHQLINPFSTRREFSLKAAFSLAVSALETDL